MVPQIGSAHRRVTHIGLALLLLVPSGCASGPPATQAVNIVVSEAAAEVFVDGTSRGTGSMSVDMARTESHSVEARLGQRIASAQIRTRLSEKGTMAIVLSLFMLFPIIYLFMDDAYELDELQVVLILPPEPVAARVLQ